MLRATMFVGSFLNGNQVNFDLNVIHTVENCCIHIYIKQKKTHTVVLLLLLLFCEGKMIYIP